MITVNLEKELIKQNKVVLTKEKALRVKEAEKLKGTDLSPLERLGMASHIKKGEEDRNKAIERKKETERFDQERVFHISQIESLCNKYYLRFLPSNLYKGSIDEDLPMKVEVFEALYGVELKKSVRYTDSTAFIVAPKEAFELKERPDDPLLFYKINSDYYYLVHKWGNDLSIWNRCKSILSKSWFAPVTALLMALLTGGISVFLFVNLYIMSGIVLIGLSVILLGVAGATCDIGEPFVKPNEWRSEYL